MARKQRLQLGLLVALAASAATVASAAQFDLVLAGGRVMDPESGLDAVRSIGIRDGRIAALSQTPLEGAENVDVSGLVVAAGFIDLHVHGQDAVSYDYMARDGVTTALDLEAGVHGIDEFIADRAGKARIHYGAAAGHIGSRVYVKHGFSTGHALTSATAGGLRGWLIGIVQRWFRPTAWMYEPADEDERAEIVAALAEQLDAGAIGIGMGLAYTPGAESDEVRAIFALAAERGVPCFVHIRDQESAGDLGPLEAVLEHAAQTGAALHVVHINSSSRSAIAEYLARVATARDAGVDVSTEAYPYTAGSTMLESALFDEGWQEHRDIDYGDLQWVATGERLTEQSFEKYRAQGGTVIIHMMQPEWIETAIAHPLVMIASDGMPMVAGAHPRGAGTHARVLSYYVRERGTITLMQALEKLSLMPARRLEAFVPAMARKGRIRVGADADLAIFDPAAVKDRATFEAALHYSEGFAHVLVEGSFVVRDGALVAGAFPGRGLRGARRDGE
jgi:dihydroorotase